MYKRQEQVKNLIDKGCDVVCVNLVNRTDEGIEAVKNEEMLGTVYNDKAVSYTHLVKVIKSLEQSRQSQIRRTVPKSGRVRKTLKKLEKSS